MASKKKLSQDQEFKVMLLVLDKFLWLGFGILTFGVFTSITKTRTDGATWIVAGAVMLLLFMWLITKEYQVLK